MEPAAVEVHGGAADLAAAHNDRTVFAGPAGPYELTASVQYLHGTEEGLRFDVAVRARDRRPIDDATALTVVATSGSDTVGPLTAERYGSRQPAMVQVSR